MSTRIVFATIFSAALLSSYSSAIAADVRPEVARALNEARVLANGWSDKAAAMAKINQAASVPNLNKDEQDKIRATTIYALARQALPRPYGFARPTVPQLYLP
jgi:hypothetical protein